MTITTTTLTRAAGLSAVTGGLLFLAVQINHPPVNLALVTTTEWKVRQSMKVLLAALSLVGITGMYLRQTKKTGVLGLVGYVVFAVSYLIMLSNEVIGLFVLPALAHSAPGYVSDVLAVANGGTAAGDIGLFGSLNMVDGFAYMGGGLVFGLALFRSGVLARWAAAVLALSTIASIAIPLLPQVNQRLFAVPTGVALVGLGYSLWREQRTPTARSLTSRVSPQLDPAGAQ
jgi:hypothetical protein